jgi:hypothetical protein
LVPQAESCNLGQIDLEWVVRAVNDCAQVVDEALEALDGYGGEHAGPVVEMMGGRAVEDADPAGHIAPADVLPRPPRPGRRGGIGHLLAEIPW